MIINILISTFLSLKAHKLRVFLTMVGIIIGITSVVTISTLGEGMKQQVLSATSSTSANNVKIMYSMEQEDNTGMGYVDYSNSDFSFSMVDLKKLRIPKDWNLFFLIMDNNLWAIRLTKN